MMKILRPGSSFTALLLIVAGCAAPPSKSPPRTSPAPPARLSALSILQQAASQPMPPLETADWQPMFDGHSLKGWSATDFAGRGEIQCLLGCIILNTGDPFTGINWTNDYPKNNYEIAMDGMRVAGTDFFCGLTVPVRDTFCSLILGGWGGSLVGISSLDGMDASENETTKYFEFDQGHWYRIRLRVTDERIQVWIDSERIVDVVTTGKRISLRPGEIEMSKPLGIASWQTTGALRNIKIRPVSGPDETPRQRHKSRD